MSHYQRIGQRIRAARVAAGMTQATLGQKLHRPRTHAAISDIERARTKLNLDELEEIAGILETTLPCLIVDTFETPTFTEVEVERLALSYGCTWKYDGRACPSCLDEARTALEIAFGVEGEMG